MNGGRCGRCGASLAGRRNDARFCSDRCRNAHRDDGGDDGASFLDLTPWSLSLLGRYLTPEQLGRAGNAARGRIGAG